MPYKILIVDDHPLIRDGLAALVSTLPGGAKVFTAANAAQALEQAEFHSPLDAVLLDCGLPDADGGSLIGALQLRSGMAPVIVVSANESAQTAGRMLELGATAFVAKSKPPSVLLNELKSALADGPARLGGANKQLSSAERRGAAAVSSPARQLDILLMLNTGLSNNDIALQLGLAEKTVKNHVTSLFGALGVTSRLQAVMTARRLRILT